MGRSRKKKNRNWDILRRQSYDEQVKTRDVHTTQDMERGKKATKRSSARENIAALFIGMFFLVISVMVTRIGMYFWGFVVYVRMNPGESFVRYEHVPPEFFDPTVWSIAVVMALITTLTVHQQLIMGLRARNAMADSTDINTYENDQHIMLVEEMVRTFDYFPDAGAHSSVQVTSMLSHVMISRKGIKRVEVVKRHEKDGDGYLKGDPMYDEDGNVYKERLPLIDEKFGQELFTASGIPMSEKAIRAPFDMRKIDYNKKDESKSRRDRDKLPYDTVTDLINNDWEFPEYEVQRPAGAYLVDTAPLNTMVLAITRAGKGNGARFVW